MMQEAKLLGPVAKSIWLVTTGEPLPIDGDGVRLLRHGLLAQMLSKTGWQVTWWTSAFDHTSKVHRSVALGEDGENGEVRELSANYRLVLLPSAGYKRNVSLARFADHADIARAFTQRAALQAKPDVILCSYPTLDLCDAASCYGQQHSVPVVLDIRDLWPDIFLHLVPGWLRPLARLVLWRSFGMSARSLKAATGIVGITVPIRDWALRRAGRLAGPYDAVFPLACAQPTLAPIDKDKADARWDRLGATTDKFIVCFFGALGRQFDFETVITAAEICQTKNPAVLFVICGAGQRLAALQAASARLTNLIVPGWIGQTDIWALMARASCGLAPYENEYSFTLSVPNKIIEYFSAGLPVVSCLRGETRQLIESQGLGIQYAERSSVALVNALERLAEDTSSRQAMARRAAALFLQDFSAQKVYDHMTAYLAGIALTRCAPLTSAQHDAD